MSSQQERDADPLIGCRVITLHSKTDDWTITAKYARRWGIVGTVTDLSNSHGLCYEIKHDDGTVAWYDPSEFVKYEVLNSYEKDSHCSYCGNKFENLIWPRKCVRCRNVTYKNPTPVSVLLLPVNNGILVIKRGIAPRIGEWALPGGFVNDGESWQEAAARETLEESNIVIYPSDISVFDVCSVPNGPILIFGIHDYTLDKNDLPMFKKTDETTERDIVIEPIELAFPLHTKMLKEFFNKKWGFHDNPFYRNGN